MCESSMTDVNWNTLNQQLAALKPEETHALNNASAAQSLILQSRVEGWWLFTTSGVLSLIVSLWDIYNNGISPVAGAAVALSVLIMVIFLSVQARRDSVIIYALITIMLISGICYWVVFSFLSGIVLTNILVGTMQFGFAIYFYNRVQQYRALSSYPISASLQALHTDLVTALATQTPNASNRLIMLRENTQRISVWLRPHVPIIYLHGVQRIHMDTDHTFALSITGTDKGGSDVRVQATIAQERRICSISRHGWLRYTQYHR